MFENDLFNIGLVVLGAACFAWWGVRQKLSHRHPILDIQNTSGLRVEVKGLNVVVRGPEQPKENK